MTKTICVRVTLIALALMVAATARAQGQTSPDNRFLLNVSVGGQVQSHSFTTANTFPMFDETASFSAAHKVGAGFLFDINGEYPVWRRIAVAAGFDTFHKSNAASLTATIPSALFYNSPTTTVVNTSNLAHTEVAFNLSAVYRLPVTSKVEVALFVGPSFIHTGQDLVQSIDVPDLVTPTPLVTHQSATATGYNVGFDARYRMTNRYAVGLFVRDVSGKARLESATVKVGGAQVGAGVRVGF